jgi:hypothetical protein
MLMAALLLPLACGTQESRPSGNSDADTDHDADTGSTSDVDTDSDIDVDGALIWARRAGGSGQDSALDVDTHSDGSSFVTGIFTGEAVFGEGEPNETTLVSAGGTDIFVARYDADGALVWAIREGGEDEDWGRGVAAFDDGSFVITGEIRTAVTFGEGGDNPVDLPCGQNGNPYVAKYDSDGELSWARGASETSWGTGHRLAAMNDGSVLVAGSFVGSITFSPGASDQVALVNDGCPVPAITPS